MLQSLARRLPFYYGWLVVAVVFVSMAVAVNARTAFSLLYPPILDEFGWDRAVTAGVFSFGFMVSALLSPVLGHTMDSRGPRFNCELGVIACGAGLRRLFRRGLFSDVGAGGGRCWRRPRAADVRAQPCNGRDDVQRV